MLSFGAHDALEPIRTRNSDVSHQLVSDFLRSETATRLLNAFAENPFLPKKYRRIEVERELIDRAAPGLPDAEYHKRCLFFKIINELASDKHLYFSRLNRHELGRSAEYKVAKEIGSFEGASVSESDWDLDFRPIREIIAEIMANRRIGSFEGASVNKAKRLELDSRPITSSETSEEEELER